MWTFDSTAYEVKRRGEFLLLGQAMNILFIEQMNPGGASSVFLFSEERGLVGFFPDTKVPNIYLLENRCGFGAKATCR